MVAHRGHAANNKVAANKKNCCCKLSDRKVCTCTDGVEDSVQLYPGPTNQSGKVPCFAVLLGQNARLLRIFAPMVAVASLFPLLFRK